MAEIRYKGQIYSGAASFGSADDVSYDNTESGLTATDVQGAVDEVSLIANQPIIQKKTLYNNSARTFTSFSISDNHADYDVLVFSFQANAEADMFHKVIFWKAHAGTYIKVNFSAGNNGVDPAYRCDARIWGGTANVIGYTVENYNSDNWKVGVVKVVGYKFINVQDLD